MRYEMFKERRQACTRLAANTFSDLSKDALHAARSCRGIRASVALDPMGQGAGDREPGDAYHRSRGRAIDCRGLRHAQLPLRTSVSSIGRWYARKLVGPQERHDGPASACLLDHNSRKRRRSHTPGTGLSQTADIQSTLA
eukprot:292238-Chlamydomonas_euryale.AAC.4